MAFKREKKLRAAFAAIKNDLDNHLEDINENTQEIFENRHMIADLHERLCKLSDQLHEVRLRLDASDMRYPSCIELSLREQEVFLVLYTATDVVAYSEVSRQVSLPVSFLQEVTYSLIQKGIPVVKQRDEQGRVLLSLDLEFKEEQSKRNIVGIDPVLRNHPNKSLQLSLLE